MGLEQRKGVSIRKPRSKTDNSREFYDGKKKNRRAFLSFARERVPTLFLLSLVVLFLFDHEFILNETQAEVELWNGSISEQSGNRSPVKTMERDGFMILGMHRSGTSMLTGLLYMAAGYTYGGVLHKGKDNTKGFFERFDVVGQNENWMKNQNISWHKNVLDFDWKQAIKEKESGVVEFKGGGRFFRFIEKTENMPWLQKDPRMCITLRAWLQVIKKEPAIVFTYRHPLEAALSLEKRKLGRLDVTGGLKLWIAYNMRAIQNSRGLCVVRTSNRAVLANPFNELQRISDELTNKCGVAAPPHPIKQEEIIKFIDPSLQHHGGSSEMEKQVLATYNDGSCIAYDFESKKRKRTRSFKEEQEIYLMAMKIYCDLESGKAYNEDYVWPDLQSIKV